MAQDSKNKGVLKRAFDRVAGVYKSAHDAVADRLVQWRHGSHDKNLARIVEHLSTLPGGPALLAMARTADVKIYIVAPADIDGARGRFSRNSKQRFVRIANNGDIDSMTTTLWHELRHVEQHIARGDMSGQTTRLLDTRRQHTFSLMHEADAFTSQFILAIRQEAAGHPEYLEKMLSRKGPASKTARDFLQKHPPAKFGSEAQLARALFTEIMLRGLAGYNATYMKGYYESFEKAGDLQSFRNTLASKSATGMPDDERLTALYGRDYMASTSLEAIATAFLHAQPQEVYDTLDLIEKTSAAADSMTEDGYQNVRRDIMQRTKNLSKAFNKAALKYPGEPRKELRAAANANRPPYAERGKGVRVASIYP